MTETSTFSDYATILCTIRFAFYFVYCDSVDIFPLSENKIVCLFLYHYVFVIYDIINRTRFLLFTPKCVLMPHETY